MLSENPRVLAELNANHSDLTVTLLPSLVVGKLNERLEFLTDNPDMPRVPAVAVSARVLGSLKVFPQLVDFGMVLPGSRQERTIVVRLLEAGSFKITGTRLDGDGLSVQLKEIEVGRLYHVVVVAHKPFKDARLDISTNVPDQPNLQVRLFGKN